MGDMELTVEEFKQVIDERFAAHEKREDSQHAEIIRQFDRINGQVETHAKEITNLKIKAGVVIGVTTVLWGIVHFLVKP